MAKWARPRESSDKAALKTTVDKRKPAYVTLNHTESHSSKKCGSWNQLSFQIGFFAICTCLNGILVKGKMGKYFTLAQLAIDLFDEPYFKKN